MEHTTHRIAPVIKHVVIDAVQAARSALLATPAPDRFCDGEDILTTLYRKAQQGIAVLDWVNAHVVAGTHDATLLATIGEVVADIEYIASSMDDPTPMRCVGARLRMASLLLQSARRERDLDGRLRAVLDASQAILAAAEDMASDDPTYPQAHQSMAEDVVADAQRIARLARA